MKNKAFIVIASLVLVLALALCMFACDDNADTPAPGPDTPVVDDPPSGDDPPAEEVINTITYEASEGIYYSSSNVTQAKKGSSVVFEFTLDVFYTGEPIVTVNNRERTVSYDEDTYTYSCKFTLTKNSTVTISGVSKAESTLLSSGTGASDSPFVIKEPIDLLTMAEVINSGADDSVMKVLGWYELDNDLDFRGQEIPIIGDGSSSTAFFGGYFNGNGHTISNFKINSDGKDYVGLFGVVQAYNMLGFTGGQIFHLKLSDYTITAKNTGSTVACGSFVGQGFDSTLVLCEAENGTLEVLGNVNYFSYVGGIIGLQRSYSDSYTSKTAYCSTKNVNIVSSSGTTYAAGGIAGYVYAEDESRVATVTNCYSTGNVSGSIHAGGIAGWLCNYTAVVSCYSTGEIHALSRISDLSLEQYCHAYAGGLVGMAQLDTIVADSFATGALSAYSALGEAYEHVGNFVGRFEELSNGLYSAREATVFNCHYVLNGKNDTTDLTNAVTIKEKLYWHDVDWLFADGAYPVINDEVNVSDDDDAETTHYTYNITIDYNGKKDKNGAGSYATSFTDQYESMCFWYLVYAYSDESNIQGVPEMITSKDGYVSYGYYFDQECTLAVPSSYVAMRDITLYAGFANSEDVVGTYYVIPDTENSDSNNAIIELILNLDCTYVCNDVYGSYNGTYVYNGEYIVFKDARFTRYFGADGIEKYQAYDFKAVKDGDNFKVFGALYTDEELSETVELITEENAISLVRKSNAVVGSYYCVNGSNTTIYEFFANGKGVYSLNGEQKALTYTLSLDGNSLSVVVDNNTINIALENGIPASVEGVALKATDSFRGKWEISALPSKYIEFDGAGNWKYSSYKYQKSGSSFIPKLIDSKDGTYTIENGKLTLDNGAEAILENGFVKLVNGKSTCIYGDTNGYYGTWTSTDHNTVLELAGIPSVGYGEGRISFITEENGRKRIETYALTYAANMLSDGNICLFYEGEYYGSISYDVSNGMLTGSVYSLSAADFVSINLYRIDEYEGEWIGGDSVLNILSFNGYGVYSGFKSIPLKGTITIGGTEVQYTLDDFTLSGSFMYQGEIYTISLDEGRGIITISYGDEDEGENTIELVKPDELYGKTFVDESGNTYLFDGKGAIDTKGTLSVNANDVTTSYSYIVENDGTISIYASDKKVGGVAVVGEIGSRSYVLSLNSESIVLGEKTAFTGTWALASSLDAQLVVGTMNYDKVLTGSVPLSIDGEDDEFDATFVMADENYLVWNVEEDFDLYLVKIADGMFVISKHLNWFNYENDDDDSDGTTEWNYSYAMTPDTLIGKWTNNHRSQVYTFDGMGLNPEALGVYGVSNLYANPDDDEGEYYYYGYFERKDGTGYDYVIFNDYSMLLGSAVKVVECAVSDNPRADQYKNEAGTRAFVCESVSPDDYILTRK